MQKKLKVSDLDDASLLKLFIGLRDRRAKRKADYEADDSSDKDKQLLIEVEFLRRFNERGIDNVSSREHGTAYRSTRSSVTVEEYLSFIWFKAVSSRPARDDKNPSISSLRDPIIT